MGKEITGSAIVPEELGLVGEIQGLGVRKGLSGLWAPGHQRHPSEFSSPPYPVPSALGPESSEFAGHSQRCATIGWGQCTQLPSVEVNYQPGLCPTPYPDIFQGKPHTDHGPEA